tara:strand:+ start:369 stop:554 length:186 start_codon:yes stop_codon:yes gene_type:complete
MLPTNVLRYNPIIQPKSKCGPFDCKIIDRNGFTKYVITGEEQSREELMRLKKRLRWLIERK